MQDINVLQREIVYAEKAINNVKSKRATNDREIKNNSAIDEA